MAKSKAADAAGPNAEKAALVQQRQRSAYLLERSKMLRDEIATLRAEQRDVVAKLQKIGDRTTPEARALRQRRIFLTMRPAEAKAELEKVLAERQALRAAKA